MEEWREVSNRVRNTLLPIAAGTRTVDFLRLVNAAYMKLATYVYISRRHLGATDLEISAIPTPPPDGVDPADLIELARRQFDDLRRDHASAGHIFVLYGTRLGLLHGDGGGDPMWQTWAGHHATAIQNADGALQGLHRAAASFKAAEDALAMALSFHPRSPAWIAWLSACRNRLLRAVYGVTTAAAMVRLMRRAVLPEYVAASMLLNA